MCKCDVFGCSLAPLLLHLPSFLTVPFLVLVFLLPSFSKPSLSHPSTEYVERFNPNVLKDSALSTHKPIEVKGPGGKATIIHAQYNTPISMYSQDAIMDAIAGQAQAQGGELAG